MKLKLLIVADTYYPKVDGTLKFIEEFIARSKDQFQISLLVPNFGVEHGHDVVYLETYSWLKVSGYNSIKFSWSNLSLIKTMIQEADLIFIQGPALASFIAIHYGNAYKKKTITYIHTLPWEVLAKFFPDRVNSLFSSIFRKISIRLYNKSTQILVPYHELKNNLIAQGVKTEINVARLGVDVNKYSPSQNKAMAKLKIGIPEESIVIGYVGRISREKNTSILLKAIAKIHRRKKLFLLVVGDGPEDQVRQFKEARNCLVTGFVDNVEEYLKVMDIFVMPSYTETTSLATLEAMSTGLPILATKVGYVKRYVSKDYNGMFFPRNSPGILAAKIDHLARNPELRQKLGENARKTVLYSFSWEKSIHRIKKYLLK